MFFFQADLWELVRENMKNDLPDDQEWPVESDPGKLYMTAFQVSKRLRISIGLIIVSIIYFQFSCFSFSKKAFRLISHWTLWLNIL